MTRQDPGGSGKRRRLMRRGSCGALGRLTHSCWVFTDVCWLWSEYAPHGECVTRASNVRQDRRVLIQASVGSSASVPITVVRNWQAVARESLFRLYRPRGGKVVRGNPAFEFPVTLLADQNVIVAPALSHHRLLIRPRHHEGRSVRDRQDRVPFSDASARHRT